MRLISLCALTTLLSLCVLPATTRADADKSLLGDWRFDEGGGDVVADSSGHGYEGQVLGAEWVKGKFGTALYFGGHDAVVTLPGPAGLDGSNALTVEAWVYWEKTGRYPNILSGGVWDPGGFLLFVSDNTVAFRLGKPGKASMKPPEWDETMLGFPAFTPGRWYHLVATFQRPDMRAYLDGKLVGSGKWDYPVGFSGDIEIGSWGTPSVCHTGMIDQVKLYNRALSAEEVLAEYEAGAAGRGPTAAGERAYEKVEAKTVTPAVALETDLIRLALDEKARVISFIDKATGKDYCARPAGYFASIKKGGVTYRPSACSYANGKLTLEFGKSGVTAQVKVSVKQSYFVFELISLSDPQVEEAVIGGLALDLKGGPGSAQVAWASNADFAAAVVPLNLQVEVGMSGGPSFAPRAVKKYGLVGAKVAVAGSPAKTVREVLKEVVRAEGLPYSPLGGPFAFDAEENRGSYLFATVSEKNVDEWIEMARRGGFAEIHLCPWWHRMGHYDPNPDLFPHGMAGLKQVADKIHAAGLRLGMHTLTGCIQVDDPWVSPVPDKRLTKDATFTLAATLGGDEKIIPTVERPEGLETFWGDMSTGNTIQIDNEIIAYTGIAKQPPYGFTGCTRGQWGTKRGAHLKGAPAYHLVASYCSYIPDENTTLVDEMAECIAKAFNTCHADMIYLDGSEGMKTSHAVAKMKRAIFTKLKGRVLVESSSGDWGAWPFHSRVGAWDHPMWGFNRFTDLHCASLNGYSDNEMLPGHMGWWVITGPSADFPGMFPEDMEYSCGKCLGWDYSISLEGVEAGRPPNARQDEYLTMLGRYERLRLGRYFTEDVRAKLRTPKEQFRLAQDDDGTWQLRPTDYAAHRVTGLPDGTASWTLKNRYAAQPAKLRIEALYACKPYDAPEGVLLTDFAKPDDFGVRATAPGVSCNLTASTEQVKTGTVSGCLTAKNSTGARRGAWTKVGKVFTPPLDMNKCGALGVWVYGDGKGELLNFQLNNTRETYTAWDDHYVDVDFTGWRYFELLLRERDAQRYQDYVWPYGGACEVGRTTIQRNRVGAFNIYFNDLPPNDEVRCFIGPVRALPAMKTALVNPALTIGGKRTVFPVTLESGQFIEYESAADCRVHDERGAIIARLKPEGDAPELAAGDNAVGLSCEGPAGLTARLKATLITQGPSLGGQAPKDNVDWSLLRTERDDPRTVSLPGLGDNAWDVICRPDAGGAALQAEIVVESAGKPAAGYDAPGALTIETFNDLARFADKPENHFAKYAYDGEDNGVPAKPGVTQSLESVGNPVKVGQRSARFSAKSARADSAGWCARGERFDPLLNLSECTAIGFWLHGDGVGESFKLQLRDTGGAWFDMVTPVDFSGWKYVEFDLAAATGIDLHKIEYALLFFNNIPGGATVMCIVDDIRALREGEFVRKPALIIGDRRLVFPVALAPGERLVYRSAEDCVVYSRDGSERERVKPRGPAAELQPGRNRVRLEVEGQSAAEYRLRVSLTKVYPEK